MESSLLKSNSMKRRRALRVRRHLRGSFERPRLCVVKTNKHLYVQLIDDEQGKTLGSISTVVKALKSTDLAKKSKESAKLLGEKIAELGKSLNISKVVFDRGPFKYHGVVAAIADAAREGGLQF
ncbi:50S ribosomal protein L18 [Chlamydiifrater phoenicopteri]|uniref:50S ribosomal protein L18 n=1 Tax=Chlamydiifrater phoenicopteri TaxID=2681469 RepID=UPI001BCF8A8C|nr:50S ribosomal protein L18 [Chlamydiifrater phoenicopteri]